MNLLVGKVILWNIYEFVSQSLLLVTHFVSEIGKKFEAAFQLVVYHIFPQFW